jgi:hypothetical protein
MARSLFVSTCVLACAAGANAQIFVESEGNDSKAAANIINNFGSSFTAIQGNSTSGSGAGLDYFDIRMAAMPLGIYRHRLILTTTGTAGHTATIRGLNQNAAPGDTQPGIPWDGVIGTAGTTDSTAQTHSTTLVSGARTVQWYGFGKQERFYYRVAGTSTTTANYLATLDTQIVTPVNIGTFQPGLITLNWNGQGHTSDTDMWVYDSNFNAIPGYGDDDSSAALSGAPIPTTALQSWLARNYAPGVYYIAVTNFNLALSNPSPSDDSFRTGTLLDFPDIAVNSSTSVNVNLTFTITDSSGASVQVSNTKAGQFDINWFTFTVVPTPGTAALLGLGGLFIARRRR